jgi:methyl-accepting chemotaxis protein
LITKRIDAVSAVAEEISASTEEVSATSQEISEATDKIAQSAVILDSSSKEMIEKVSRFKI